LSGESDNIAKKVGDKILAGSIIAAGTVTVKAQKTAEESYLATMTQNLKHYKKSLSPIQKSLLKFIQLMACLLAVIAAIILFRTFLGGGTLVNGVIQIAAVAATIIAEGLILASTAFFVYGAVRLARKKVLLQQINAIENFGRLSIVCVDKTGTLTQNQPKFDSLICFDKKRYSEKALKQFLATYVSAEPTTTTTMKALKDAYTDSKPSITKEYLPFSSLRKYGALRLLHNDQVIVVGASDYFAPLLNSEQKDWVNQQVLEQDMQEQQTQTIRH
jgi:cation-transporting ATPase E